MSDKLDPQLILGESGGNVVTNEQTRVIKTRRYKVGYEVRTKECSWDSEGQYEVVVVRLAYTPDGAYIGNPRWAHRLIVQRGITPQLREPDYPVCSIGFCEREQKWYGWSHRAMYGFSVGDIVKEGDCTASSGWIEEYLAEHPEDDLSLPIGFQAQTLDDAKRMAIAFADSVA